MPWGWALGAEEVQRVPVSNGMGGLEGEEKPAKGLGRSAGQRVCPGSQWEGSVPRRRKRSGWHGLRMERSENPAGVGQHGGPGDSSGEARQVWDRARAEVWWGWAIWGDITPGEQSRKRRGGGWEEGELLRKPAGKPPARQGGGLAPCHSSCSVFTKALLCPVPSLAHA